MQSVCSETVADAAAAIKVGCSVSMYKTRQTTHVARHTSHVTRPQDDSSVFAGMARRAAKLMDVLRRKTKSRDMFQLSSVSASAAGSAAPFVSRNVFLTMQDHAFHFLSTQVAASASAFLDLGQRQSIMRSYISSINCQWMSRALGYCNSNHHQENDAQDQQDIVCPFCLPPHLNLSDETIGCISGPVVRCMQATEFVQVSQINACALALTCLFKPRNSSDPASSSLPPRPSLSTTAAIFHQFGVPGNFSN
jgi:hypothetical protein